MFWHSCFGARHKDQLSFVPKGRLLSAEAGESGDCRDCRVWAGLPVFPPSCAECLFLVCAVQDMVASPYQSTSDSFYFVNDELVMHNKAEYRFELESFN